MLGDKAEVTITFEGPDAEPKVEGGAPYQIIFTKALGFGPLACTRLDLGILLEDVRGIMAEVGDKATPA